MTQVPTLTLANGVTIPQLGFGTYKVPQDQARDTVLQAIDIGYRHIDTAQMYGNEAGVGAAVRDSGIPRSEFFITSKLNNPFHAHGDALAAFERTMAALQFDVLDLFLIHWPLPGIEVDFLETWDAMEAIAATGRVRAIGVSNFSVAHLERLLAHASMPPQVNQIEAHPYLVQEELRAYDREHGIATEAWSPIARGAVLDDPVVVDLADTIGRTPSQVVLRWHVQRGDIVFPKTMSEQRMRENFAIFDFELTPEQMALVTGLERGHRTGPDPEQFNWIPEV